MKKYLNNSFKRLLILLMLVVGVFGGLVQGDVEGQGVSELVSYMEPSIEAEDQYSTDTNARRPAATSSTTHTEETSGLMFEVPAHLTIDGYVNTTPASYVINWNKTILLTQGESIMISVWNRDTIQTMEEVYQQIISMDGCESYTPGTNCMVNFPAEERENSSYVKYFLYDKTLVRVMYAFSHLYEVGNFKIIANSITLNSNSLFSNTDFEILDNNAQVQETTMGLRGATSCGGLYDSNNPYDCCYSSNPGQNDANCTWYAAYKRPDLKGTITLYPGGLFNQAKQAGKPTSYNQPVPGSLIVWQWHVAYVESVGSNSVTWSEQNCYNAWYKSDGSYGGAVNAFNASVTRNSYTPDYGAGTFLGYILPSETSNSCSGTSPIMSNWNASGPLSCTPVSSLTILPDSRLQSINGDIKITPI